MSKKQTGTPARTEPSKERRPQGDGSITLRADGRWHARVDLGVINGKRVRKSLYGKTPKEVAAKLRDALKRKSQGTLVTGPRQTFGQFLDRWLRDVVTPKCRPKTISSYRGLIDRHIKPSLGRVALAKLAASDLQAFYAQKREEKLAPRTIVYLHALIRASLKHAERSGEIGYSPRVGSDEHSARHQAVHDRRGHQDPDGERERPTGRPLVPGTSHGSPARRTARSSLAGR
jgi:integrase